MFSLRQYITSPGYTGIRTFRWGVGLLVAVWVLLPQILSGQAVQPELWIPREILASEGPIRSGQSSLALLRQKHSQDLLVFWAMEPREFFTKKAAFMASLQDYQHAVDGILKGLVSIQPETAPGGGRRSGNADWVLAVAVREGCAAGLGSLRSRRSTALEERC